MPKYRGYEIKPPERYERARLVEDNARFFKDEFQADLGTVEQIIQFYLKKDANIVFTIPLTYDIHRKVWRIAKEAPEYKGPTVTTGFSYYLMDMEVVSGYPWAIPSGNEMVVRHMMVNDTLYVHGTLRVEGNLELVDGEVDGDGEVVV